MTPYEVRQAITTRIAALPVAAGYQQSATDAWTEAKVPLIPELTPEPAAHLSFFVDNRNLSLTRSRANSSELLYVQSTWTIRFLSRMRAADRVGDWDKANAATVALWKWLLASGWTTEIGITPADNFSTIQVVGDFLAVSLNFELTFATEAV
jgi:hypothetical protein